MHNKSIRGGRINLDRERAIGATVTRAGGHNIAPFGVAAERICNRAWIKRYFVELSIVEAFWHGSERNWLMIALGFSTTTDVLASRLLRQQCC
jgi:hypothetical protein